MTAQRASHVSVDAVPQLPLVDPFASVDRAPALGQVGCGARRVVEAVAAAQAGGDRRGWVRVAAACQALVNTLSAVQDAAIVQVARREQVWSDPAGAIEEAEAATLGT